MNLRATLLPVLEVLLGQRRPREGFGEIDDAALARELFVDGFDSLDIARGLGLPEWRVLMLLERGRRPAAVPTGRPA